MYRRLTLFGVLLLLIVTSLPAQIDDEEEPLPPPRRAQTKIGGAGGFTPVWLFMDVDPINKWLSDANAGAFDKGGVTMYGGQGYGYILFVRNLRVGGMGISGSMDASSVDVNNIRREVEMSVGAGGVTLDYVFPVLPRLDIAAGILLGGGGISMRVTKNNGQAFVWDSVWNQLGSPGAAQNYSVKMNGGYFMYMPSVNLEYAVLRWLGVRVGVGYLGTAGGSWEADDQFDISNVPDDITPKGWVLNTGIFIGTFLF